MPRYLALMGLALAAPIHAQDAPALPDPATIEVPSVALPADPAARAKVLGDGYKFFYFHNPAIGFAEALSDVADCRGHLPTGRLVLLPGFIPYGETNRRDANANLPVVASTSVLGAVVGVAVVSGLNEIIAPKMERGLRNNKLRRCMETRGYVRYAVAEKTWELLNEGDEAKLIAMQAKLAIGPKPDQPEVER